MAEYEVGKAPWETDSTPASFEAGKAPWEATQQETVLNEMHPDIDTTTRLIYKNLGADPEASFNYLQKVQPNLQWKKAEDGEVLAKRPEETEWKKLDPSGMFTEPLRDIGDVLYDVPAAVAQGTATVLGGLGGAAAGGVGALPGAALASAGSGVALEGLRQSLGEAAMRAQTGEGGNLSGSDLAWAGGLGLASPLVFGAGGSTKEAAKYAAKSLGSNASTESIKELTEKFMQSQRGALGRGWDKLVAPAAGKAASVLGGYAPETLKEAYKKLQFIKDTEATPELGEEVITNAMEEGTKAVRGSLSTVGKELEDVTTKMDATGARVEVNKILSPLMDLRNKISSSKHLTEAKKATIAELDDIMEKYFKVDKELLPDPFALGTPLEGATVKTLKPEAAGKFIPAELPLNPLALGTPPGEQKLLSTLMGEPAGTLVNPVSKGAKSSFSPTEVVKELPQTMSVKDAEAVRGFLKDYVTGSGVNFNLLGSAKGINQAKQGSSKTINNTLFQVSDNISDAITKAVDDLDPKLAPERDVLRQRYSTLKTIQDEMQKSTMSEEGMKSFLNKKGILAESARNRVGKDSGVDLKQLSSQWDAMEMFRNPRWQIPSFGGPNTARTLAAPGIAGALAFANEDGSPTSKMGVGAATMLAGMGALSPAGIRMIMTGNKALRAAPGKSEMTKYLPYLMMNPNLNDQGE